MFSGGKHRRRPRVHFTDEKPLTTGDGTSALKHGDTIQLAGENDPTQPLHGDLKIVLDGAENGRVVTSIAIYSLGG